MTSNEQHVQASEPDRPEGGDASANGHRGRRPGSPSSSGATSEHAVSCATAAGVMRAIDRDKYDIVPIGVSRDGQWVLAADDPARFELTAGRTPEVLPDEAHVVLPLSTRETALTVLEAGQPPTELGNVDVVLPLLHGPFGEDGTLQGSSSSPTSATSARGCSPRQRAWTSTT